MSLKHGLLGLLQYADMTGYELGKAFGDSLSFFWQAQSSQIYRELNKMQEEECLTSRIEIQSDKPNKRIYSITDKGRAQFQNWLSTDIAHMLAPIRSEMLLQLFFSSQRSKEKNIEFFQTMLAICKEHALQMAATHSIIAEYSATWQAPEDAVYWEMTAEFGRASSAMYIEWAEKCMRQLKEEQK